LKAHPDNPKKIRNLVRQLDQELKLVQKGILKAKLLTEFRTDMPLKSKSAQLTLKQSIQELCQYLSGYDARADEAFQALKGQLSQAISATDLATIEQAITQYDYDRALDLLNRLN